MTDQQNSCKELILKTFSGWDIYFLSASGSSVSLYFEINGLKCRFSNHGISNKVRLDTEICFDLPNASGSNLLVCDYSFELRAKIYKARLTNKQKRAYSGWLQIEC